LAGKTVFLVVSHKQKSMKKLSVDQSNWTLTQGVKFDFNLSDMEPVKATIKLSEVESINDGVVTFKRTKNKFPFLPLTVTNAAGHSKRLGLGAQQGLDLLDVMLVEETADQTIVGYFSMTDGEFSNESPIRIKAVEEAVEEEVL
jgi:uncharacterized ubiquitin-like protein YukD